MTPSPQSDRTRAASDQILVEIAPGELLDKITILQIKSERIQDPSKLTNVRRELEVLSEARSRALPQTAELDELTAALKSVNEELWDIEDDIRRCELAQSFEQRFIELARAVYHTNDRRAALKRRINEATGSDLVEEKEYVDYEGDSPTNQ